MRWVKGMDGDVVVAVVEVYVVLCCATAMLNLVIESGASLAQSVG